MDISYHTILKKIEEKVIEAKSTGSDTRVREHVQAIKALCEVILMEETKSEPGEHRPTTQAVTTPSSPAIIIPSIPSQPTGLGEKKLVADDGANGDSLFDF